ncbi:MAG: SpoVA/SpoVAEb family sporulation membrane protein [Clostridia bacterium]|nr:SpoVA/SpoVAEb family sporulation membrane protein [Clostridia bacterium]
MFLHELLPAFLTGGLICAFAQILIDKTNLTPARVVVLFVSLGVALTALGLYDAVVDFGGAGATVPIVGFGYALAKGVEKGVSLYGPTGILSGGVAATAAGIAAAVVFGWLAAVLSKSTAK